MHHALKSSKKFYHLINLHTSIEKWLQIATNPKMGMFPFWESRYIWNSQGAQHQTAFSKPL